MIVIPNAAPRKKDMAAINSSWKDRYEIMFEITVILIT